MRWIILPLEGAAVAYNICLSQCTDSFPGMSGLEFNAIFCIVLHSVKITKYSTPKQYQT